MRLLAPKRDTIIRFAREALLREGVAPADIQFDEGSFRFILGSGDQSVYLENLFEVYGALCAEARSNLTTPRLRVAS